MFHKIVNLIKMGINVSKAKREIQPMLSKTEKVTILSGKIKPAQILTAEERKSPLSKYFDIPMATPNSEHVKLLAQGPIDSSLALPVERLNDLLNPGYLETEIGYCVMSNGKGFFASMVQMPDVTPEMLDWWFCWHPLESLRYKIWNPKAHYSATVDEENRKHLLDTSIPIHQRAWGTKNVVNEDIGAGPMKIEIEFASPFDVGFDRERFYQGAATAFCGDTDTKMVHVARRLADGGVELRSRFWSKASVPISILKELAFHNLEEYTHLANVLPDMYKEFGPEVK